MHAVIGAAQQRGPVRHRRGSAVDNGAPRA